MALVHRLPDALANQIAAGEVVERPASAAKELVENALDAGARRIDIRLEDGGRRLLEVVDDGSGMSREDALLSLERHTTSKLSTADDLFDIHTFGFRGEALPSIASVSRFTLTTRRNEDDAATRITVEGGTIASVEECGAPVGTRIEIKDLFFNVPARLKFLKTRATELGHVTDWITRLGLTRPDVAFSVNEETKSHLRAEPTNDLRERIAALLGREVYGALYPVQSALESVRVTGYVAGPQRANNTAREIFTFVNGRFIRDRGLLHAIARAYEGVLQIGRSPACVLFLEVPRDRVDVNVHPQKLEVRFADRSVYDAVAKSVAMTLASSPWLSRANAPTRTYELKPSEPVEPAPKPIDLFPKPSPQQRIADALQRYSERNPDATDLPARAADSFAPYVPAAPRPTASPVVVLPVPPDRSGPRMAFSELRYLGQVHRTYLVCESPEGLVLLDQHAAHERVLYERYRKDRAGAAVKGQPFLVPITLELSPADAQLVSSALEELADLGFELEPFGGHTFSLQAAPSELGGADMGRVIRELAGEIQSVGRGVGASASEEALLARMACHSAVRAGHSLTPPEVDELLRSLDGTPFNATCPHGRPVVVRFDTPALKEMFGRTYEGTPRAAIKDRLAR